MTDKPSHPHLNEARFSACLDLLARSGTKQVQIRYHDDEEPCLWLVYGKWSQGEEAAGGLDPLTAATRLLETIMDGVGACAHCGKATAVTFDWELPTFLDQALCWYIYDPETERFRRSCEGETTGRVFGRNPRTGETVGRNDPCPCGSGKKWKKCHGAG
jgi:hypothetical protein